MLKPTISSTDYEANSKLFLASLKRSIPGAIPFDCFARMIRNQLAYMIEMDRLRLCP